MFASIGFAFLAGVVSILSPCVLPILPIVLGGAASEHRRGPLVLAAGLALSFTVIGLFVATIGFSLGLDLGVFRMVAGFILLALGLAMLVPAAGARLATAAGPLSDWTQARFGGFDRGGLSGQFGVGLLLGAVWSPCVGPTLGAASLMAARGENLGQVGLTMLAFGIGAGLPLAALGALSREKLLGLRERMMAAGQGAKTGLGLVVVAVALLVLTGWDKLIEARLVELSPAWLTALTTRF
ncbi:cytochrome c biogenesis CcdA family protein [Phreatobacter oligotrophus]|jgi:cytochrome c-type biogenesis protein|uniref:cytochrome c biogenesis CcdA family protein n=1 Tax=Phreatobacter oligotrophus TaxID=1122261 RepID=UPI002356601E|nr:cytochrome c biogenesis CcdA family protein [Phreatobacter oligotrophus]MBX9991538.1 cytochrome c biogenesis CcdA family protein [Phreatobacter oligotrophus]